MKRIFFKKMFVAVATALILAGCSASRDLCVLQFNIWQEGTVVPGGFEAMADEIARLDPDFVTLSETRNYNNTRFCDRITAALSKRGKNYYSFYSYDSGLLSRYPITDSATIFPIQGDHGTIYKMRTRMGKHEIAVYTAHLDYQNDTYYEIRGYDGCDWHKMEAPLTDVKIILERNALSLRDEAIKRFIADAQKEIKKGTFIFLGGDFNEPSHLDWVEATKDSADHQGVVVPWLVTTLLEEVGFKDAYRTHFPNPVTHPGYTYPSDNDKMDVKKLTWAPLADERDRIDYVFFYPRKGLKLKEAHVVGPKKSIRRSERVTENTQDSFIIPQGVWPSDHKGVMVKFRLR